jgi:hypothetical protein
MAFYCSNNYLSQKKCQLFWGYLKAVSLLIRVMLISPFSSNVSWKIAVYLFPLARPTQVLGPFINCAISLAAVVKGVAMEN